MRVFELAKKLGISSKELTAAIQKMGIDVKNHMSAISESDLSAVERKFKVKKDAVSSDVAPEAKKTRVLIKKKLVVEPAIEEKREEEPRLVSSEQKVEAPQTPPLSPVSAGPSIENVIQMPLPQDSHAAGPVKEVKKPLVAEAVPLVKKEMKDQVRGRAGRAKKIRKIQESDFYEYRDASQRWQGFKILQKREDKTRERMLGSSGAVTEITKPRKKVIKISPGLTVKEFSELIGQKATEVIKKLMEIGTLATINDSVDPDTAVLIAEGSGLKVEVEKISSGENLLEEEVDDPSLLIPRPPVVTVMGHVDHGKTSLLDAIRQTKVADQEAGGITQHIGASVAMVGDRRVVFLDTPGHEAFTAMRARGAQVTDIVVLVVAADDGVMPQTIEAINHARAAQVPLLVAINKIDKGEANPERVKHELAEQGLIPEAWGGQTICVEVSAKKKLGLSSLLEMVLLQAEVLDLKANPRRRARGTIIEARLDKGRGPAATVLVRTGVLRVGDIFVCGVSDGKVRALLDDTGRRVSEATPSMPVEVIGFSAIPQAGDSFVVVEDDQVAKEIATSRLQKHRLAGLPHRRKITLEDLSAQVQEGAVKELNLIIKADTQGSVEALKEALSKLSTEKVKVRIIHGDVGGPTESDVLLASASNAVIIGFHVRPSPVAHVLAEREKVDIRVYTVIYEATAAISAAMEGLLEPTLKERVLGRAEVRQTFSITKVGVIAGTYVLDGVIVRSSEGARVLRDHAIIYEGKLSSLKRFKDDVKEVQAGYECGMGIENFNDIKVGDVIEVYTLDRVPSKLTEQKVP